MKPPDVIMLTVPRPGGNEYVFQTLADYEAKCKRLRWPVYLAVGVPDTAWLQALGGKPWLGWFPLPPALWAKCRAGAPTLRLMYNFYRVLALPLKPGAPGRLMLEDDIVFAPECCELLSAAIAEVPPSITKYALALYCTQNMLGKPNRRITTHLYEYPPGSYYGAQGLYISRALLPELTAYVKRNGVELRNAPNDIQVNHMIKQAQARRQNIRLFAVQPNIVQHVGKVTTGVGRWHQSPTFGKPWSKV